jgi:hypothetical protein
LSFALDHTSLAYDYSEGANPPSQTITATAQGSYSGTLYVGAVVEGSGIDPSISLAASGTQGTFTIRAASGLAAGNYTGRVLLMACSDAQCNNRIGGTPIAVPYTVHVRTVLRLTPNVANITGPNNTESGIDISVTLPEGTTTSTVSIAQNPEDFRLENVTPTSFRIVGRRLPAGIRNGVARVDAGNSVQQIPITYTVNSVTPDVQLSVAPFSLAFSASEGAASSTKTFTVTPASWDSNYQARISYLSGSNWLSLTPMAGGYQLRADAAQLIAGTYQAVVIVSGALPVQSQSVSVSFTVGTGLVAPADVHHVVQAETTAGQLTGSVAVNLVAGGPVNWTAATNGVSWLHLTNASGTTGGTLNYTLDTAALAALTNRREYEATVTLTPAVSTITPKSFRVFVRLALPDITSVGPYLQVSDRPLRLFVRGSGFDAIANVASRLQFGGTTPTTITRVSDTELLVTASVPAAGSYPVSVTNALGYTTAAASYRVIDPRSFAYAKLASVGNISGMIYDASRGVVYLQNDTASALQRFTAGPVGDTWSQVLYPVSGLRSIGLSSDARHLLLQYANSSLAYVDPDNLTFTEQKRFTSQSTLNTGVGVLPVTNDGRVWFSFFTGSALEEWGYFDPQSEAFAQLHLSNPTTLIGQNYALGRDGERLIVNQNSCCTPRPPLMIMDAADAVVDTLDAPSMNPFYFAHASDDGNRIAHSYGRVVDRNLAIIGDAVLSGAHANWIPLGLLMQPQGNRLYMLAYNSSDFGSLAPPVPTYKPRVYVFDTSTAVSSPATLPLKGWFEIDDYPTCRVNTDCDVRPQVAISPDGRTLFFAGSAGLLVVPVPAENTLQAAAAPPGGGGVRMQVMPWNLGAGAR